MTKIFLYGHLKKINDPHSSYSNNKPVELVLKENDTLASLLEKLKIKPEWIGEIFIEGKVVNKSFEEIILKKETQRIAIFPIGMHLLCGGQHLKGHGFITKKPGKKVNYW